jgi:hypothetical protein
MLKRKGLNVAATAVAMLAIAAGLAGWRLRRSGSSAEPPGQRKIVVPAWPLSRGMLVPVMAYVREWDSTDEDAWEPVPCIRQRLLIPAGKELKLVVVGCGAPLELKAIGFIRWQLFRLSRGRMARPEQKSILMSLAFLDHLGPNDVQEIALYKSLITPAELRHITRLTGLRRLEIDFSGGFEPSVFEQLERLPQATRLELGSLNPPSEDNQPINVWNGWPPASASSGTMGLHLAKLSRLRQLTVANGSAFSEADLTNLAQSKSLEAFGVPWGQPKPVKSEWLRILGAMPSLRALDLRAAPLANENRDALGGFALLRKIRFHAWRFPEAALREMPAWPDIEQADLTLPQITTATLARLGESGSLRTLRIENAPLDDGHLAVLAGKKSLRRVSIRLGSVTDAGLARIGELKLLERLELDMGSSSTASLAPIGEMNSLRSLTLRTSRRGLAIAPLAGLVSLEQLRLEIKNLSDEELAHLAGLKALRSLTIASERFTGAGLAHLKGLALLRELTLRSSWPGGVPFRLNEVATDHLVQLPALETLALSVGDHDPETISLMKRLSRLKRLDLAGSTGIGDKEAADLRRALPNCDLKLVWY